MPMTPYKGSASASSPSVSDNPYLVTLTAPLPAVVPVTITHATTGYTVTSADQTILVDTSGGVVTINLTASPDDGQIVNIKRITTDGTTLTIGRNGNNIEGAAANFTDSNAGTSFYTFQYDSTSGSWWLI